MLHEGAWRVSAPSIDISPPELLAILPRIIALGSAGVVWPRVFHRRAEYGSAARALAEAYAAQLKDSHVWPTEMARAVARLRQAGIEPVLVKGWAIGRLYPPPALRPAGDIDLWVPLQDAPRTRSLLFDDVDPIRVDVDIQHPRPHVQYSWLNANQDALAAAMDVIDVHGVPVRVPCAEDHLRMLCLHFLGHGALRPTSLCDVALLLEARDRDFDWSRCLGRDGRQRGWVLTTLRLAHELLGADIGGTPAASDGARLPPWLIPAVLMRWQKGRLGAPPRTALESVSSHPSLFWTEIKRRWPDQVTATLRMNAPFNGFPRWPVQLASFTAGIGLYAVWQFPGQCTSLLARRWDRHSAPPG